MKTGRPTKPLGLRQLENSHHRRINPSEPKVIGSVRPPAGLSKQARQHWRRLAKILLPLNLLTPADRDSFAMLAYSLATIDKARAEIATSGEVVAFRGRPIQNPYLTVLRGAENIAQRLFGEFGLSPSARTRLFSALNPPTGQQQHQHHREQELDVAERYFEDGSDSIQ